MREKSRPTGVRTGAAQGNIDNGYPTQSSAARQRAYCELHGVNLVHRLPPRCPMATHDPLHTLAQLQALAWSILGQGVHNSELPEALALLDAKDVCMACIDRLLPHPTVRRLRMNKGVAA